MKRVRIERFEGEGRLRFLFGVEEEGGTVGDFVRKVREEREERKEERLKRGGEEDEEGLVRGVGG